MGYEDDDDLDSWGRHISHARPDSDNKTSLDWYDELSDKLKSLLGDVESSTKNNSSPQAVGKLDGVFESDLLDLSLDNFLTSYFERNGKCFFTEVRNSGVYICGVHKTVWDYQDTEIDKSKCPQIVALEEDFRNSIKSAAIDLVDRNSKGRVVYTKNSEGNIIPSTFGKSSSDQSKRKKTSVYVPYDDDGYYYREPNYDYDHQDDWDTD